MARQSSKSRANALAAAFTDLGPAWGRWVTVCTPAQSVSYIRLRLLRALDQDGDRTLTQMALALNITQRRITALAGALADEGLIDRRPNPSDGRSTVISLSELVREHLTTYWAQFEDDISAAFGELPPELQKQLLAITPVLTDILRRQVALRLTTEPESA